MDKELVRFTVSEHFEAVLRQATPEERQKLREVFEHFLKQMISLKQRCKYPRDRARIFHKAIDAFIRKEIREGKYDDRISCKKSCHFCCFIKVAMTADEYDLIRYHIRNKGIRYSLNGGGCGFLEKSLCNIYDVRPSSCRKYFSIDEPWKCDIRNPRMIIVKFVSIRAEALYSSAINVIGSRDMDDFKNDPANS